MKFKFAVSSLLLFTLMLALGGCGKKEEAAPVTAPAKPAAAAPAAAGAAEDVKALAEKAQKILEEAKGLADGGKYQEAVEVLKGISSFKLTPDQEKLLADINALIQKNVSSEGADKAKEAVGDLVK